jgi:hypothetical protein
MRSKISVQIERALLGKSSDVGISALGIDSGRMTSNSDVTRLGSSSRAPLLAPSPLRTGLEGFPFIRLEHPKTPP